VLANPLLSALIEAGDPSILRKDSGGTGRFAAHLRNAAHLAAALDHLETQPRWATLVAANRQRVLDLYESVFDHRRFTGRSGAKYGYEGVGCVYWHMVSKLLLAVQETYFRALDSKEPATLVEELVRLYHRVREGLGFNKTPAEYGAFPADPYSHTPGHGGAQQPGMTGQVKEEILTRQGELGVRIGGGTIRFEPSLLHRSEFALSTIDWAYVDLNGQMQSLQVPAGGLAFTFCQTPVIYHLSTMPATNTATFTDGQTISFSGAELDEQTSAAVLGRTGAVARIDIHLLDNRSGGTLATHHRIAATPFT
jgi:hypothetical protein